MSFPGRHVTRRACAAPNRCLRPHSTSTASTHPPLRVLFCGSDDFSIYSLRALDEFRQAQPAIVESIDVVCRSDKRTGRGLKQIHAVPIKSVAGELGLQLHQLDTFSGWSPPKATNLIITASFGLLVPARILSQAAYGGLNVHPSLLPDFRGAAPIQHAIIQRVSKTGVSVQTMHPTKFDHGIILAQKEVAVQSKSPTTDELIEQLGPMGGRLLVESIRQRLFLNPAAHALQQTLGEPIRRAPKIQSKDREIVWDKWTAEDIMARDCALGHLWDRTSFARCNGSSDAKRVVFKGPWKVVSHMASSSARGGTPSLEGFTTTDGALVSPSAATIEGGVRDKGLATLRRLLSR